MKKIDINVVLFLILIIIALFAIKNYQFEHLRDYYLFEVNKTEKIYGFVSKSEIYDDRDGGRSYRYAVKYLFRGKEYILNENSSPLPLSGVNLNDSVLVRLVPQNPTRATIKDVKVRNLDMLLVVLVTIAEVMLIARFFKYLSPGAGCAVEVV